ncbi:hypothetical protein [Jannaschia ovalis]|uniref:Uncharacterized protein n=1 Tax=Jannaschia ovalis TaxID=3038773 RepID=A0ABY8LIQ6_9RHOB|nr:hypothetical protein [Jannaschia sp. GRR-S6-38]WGH80045.1 hypothetical protein P8627_07225 [Jannaschia sp. GRR-S6-38]
MGALGRLIRAAPLLATLAATGWALSANPFAAPFVERSTAELSLALERQVARRASAEWLRSELAQAVAARDADRAAMLLALADDLGREVPRAEAEALLAEASGWMASAASCGACMADIGACPGLAQLAACAIPFEMSPLGDLNALRRAGLAWADGAEIDRLDAGLALVGLGATGALLASGGTSLSVKAGAGLLRTARRMGTLTPGLARSLRVPIRPEALPGWLAGTRTLDEVTDTARLAAAGAVAADMGRVRAATSTAEALRLARLVDGPDDAARLARVAEAAGPRTSRTLAVLGKARAFRATIRLSRAAAGALALIWLSLLQLGIVLATRAGGLLLRAAAPQSAAPLRPRTRALGPAGPRPIR